jgi:hypothetical protein
MRCSADDTLYPTESRIVSRLNGSFATQSRAKQTLPNVFFGVLANYSIRARLITENFFLERIP